MLGTFFLSLDLRFLSKLTLIYTCAYSIERWPLYSTKDIEVYTLHTKTHFVPYEFSLQVTRKKLSYRILTEKEQKVNVELWVCKADMLVENGISEKPLQYSLMSVVQNCDQHKNITIQRLIPFLRQPWQIFGKQDCHSGSQITGMPSIAPSVTTLYLQNPRRPRSCWSYL